MDCFIRRTEGFETVPSHQRAQSAGRGSAQTHQFELIFIANVLENSFEDADLERSVHSAALATDDYFLWLVHVRPLKSDNRTHLSIARACHAIVEVVSAALTFHRDIIVSAPSAHHASRVAAGGVR